jgi:hypothetical protein
LQKIHGEGVRTGVVIEQAFELLSQLGLDE